MSGADFSIGMLAGAVLSAYGWLLFFDPPQCAEFRKNGDGRATCMRYVPEDPEHSCDHQILINDKWECR